MTINSTWPTTTALTQQNQLPPVAAEVLDDVSSFAAKACMKAEAVRWLFWVAKELVDSVDVAAPLAVADEFS